MLFIHNGRGITPRHLHQTGYNLFMPSQPWFVYVVQCADSTYYIGISNDVQKRIDDHNSGKGAKYTQGRLPVKLIYQEEYPDRSTASKREAELKSWPRKKKEQLIKRKLNKS